MRFRGLEGYMRNFKLYKDICVIMQVFKDVYEILPKTYCCPKNLTNLYINSKHPIIVNNIKEQTCQTKYEKP